MHIEQSDPSLPRWLIKPMVAFARVANPWLLRVAGHSGVPIAAVHHLGRRSGRRYANPVTAFPTSNGFVISLPYGSETDWCRNVLVSERASIRWQGVEYPVVRAEVLGRTEALPLFSPRLRAVVRLAKLRQFLRVHTRS